ncbi:hypothetical protein ACFODO_19150 [Acinetobacter sichuanensis]|uniref:Uncharacterized protein n=1 Tax=Acinetobacter sichuanensis TaxID=2136183 RepID=A0A371YIN7_9GAMM|nr:hypothetical protein [Acinetobacter sichuanensis]RFC81338.1 hypothetical protein C9E89_022420 [Acinetobacter sichuanensis]
MGCIYDASDNTKYIPRFNEIWSPEFILSKQDLSLSWKGDKQHSIEDLKLKIPLRYLNRALDRNNELEPFSNFLHPHYGHLGTFYQAGRIDDVWLELRPSTGEHVPYGDFQTGDYLVIINKEIQTDDRHFRATSWMKNPEDIIYRGKDVEGLESYVYMRCYDIEEIQQKAKEGNPTNKNLLKRFEKKHSGDFTPQDCLESFNTDFWVTPENTPLDQKFKIEYRDPMVGYEFKFLYKNRLVTFLPRWGGATKAIKEWTMYRQQIITLLNRSTVLP